MSCNKKSKKSKDSNLVENKNVPEGWTKFDKHELLQALKAYGSNNVEKIQLIMPKKSLEEIKQVIDYYKQKGLHHTKPTKKKKERKTINSNSKVPLAMWAKFLMDSFQYHEMQTETATALRLIAEFENIPSPQSTSDIDFRQIYHALANALEGKTLPNDPAINYLLEKCILETAYISKSFIRNSALRHVIDSVDLLDKEISVFPRPTEDNELATLRHLAVQRNYNPLNVPEEYLKPSLVLTTPFIIKPD